MILKPQLYADSQLTRVCQSKSNKVDPLFTILYPVALIKNPLYRLSVSFRELIDSSNTSSPFSVPLHTRNRLSRSCGCVPSRTTSRYEMTSREEEPRPKSHPSSIVSLSWLSNIQTLDAHSSVSIRKASYPFNITFSSPNIAEFVDRQLVTWTQSPVEYVD